MILKKTRRRRRSTATIGVLALGSLALGSLTLAGCTSQHTSPGVIDVVGAENQYGDVLTQIGGSYVHVTSVVSNPNTDPHNFEASPSVARAVAGARIIVQNGAGYDTFMTQLESASPSSKRMVLVVAQLRDQVSAANPHFWYSPSTMPSVATFVTNALAKIAPKHAAYFRSRDADFMSGWRSVTSAISAARLRYGGRAVATTEPVADYLLQAMGLQIRTPFRFEADVMNGIDPSPEDIVTQQNLLNTHAVIALCFNAQVSSPVTLALINLATRDHVPTVAVYETMPTGLHVQTWMVDEIAAIDAALAHGTSTASIS